MLAADEKKYGLAPFEAIFCHFFSGFAVKVGGIWKQWAERGLFRFRA
jgi:hypothetical protein